MGLFYRRALCFFCFLFVCFSIISAVVGFKLNLILLCVSVVLCVACAFYCFFAKKQRVRGVFALICLFAVLLSLLNSFVRIDMQRKNASELVGEQVVAFDVLEKERISEYTNTYTVRIERVGNNDVSYKAYAVFAFSVDLNVGDRVYTKAELTDKDNEKDDRVLTAFVYGE